MINIKNHSVLVKCCLNLAFIPILETSNVSMLIYGKQCGIKS